MRGRGEDNQQKGYRTKGVDHHLIRTGKYILLRWPWFIDSTEMHEPLFMDLEAVAEDKITWDNTPK